MLTIWRRIPLRYNCITTIQGRQSQKYECETSTAKTQQNTRPCLLHMTTWKDELTKANPVSQRLIRNTKTSWINEWAQLPRFLELKLQWTNCSINEQIVYAVLLKLLLISQQRKFFVLFLIVTVMWTRAHADLATKKSATATMHIYL